MEFEHVTFDLPHGALHALQGGDPDGPRLPALPTAAFGFSQADLNAIPLAVIGSRP
jgi:hypothetical protein